MGVTQRSLNRPAVPSIGGMSGEPKTQPPAESGATAARLSQDIEALVSTWSTVIRTAARRFGLSSADLDEVTQDVRLRVWRHFEREPHAQLNASYGYRAATSAAIDLVRRERTRVTTDADTLVTTVAPLGDDVYERLAESIAALPVSRRNAVRLHLDGRSLNEIARVLGWTDAQARNQVYRGLADLKELLTRGADDPR